MGIPMLQLPVVRMPKAVPLQRERTPQENIPQTKPGAANGSQS